MVKEKQIISLNGLRAYSALGVLAFHTDLGYFWYGWVGVQFFFVLSGFLITGILLDSREASNYFSTFYARRSLRIFPVYYLLLFIVILVSIHDKANIDDLGYFIFYLQNFHLSYHYWVVAFPGYMNHTWSLAIEEQFYIFFPFIVRYVKGRYLAGVCAFMVLIATLSRYTWSRFLPDNPIIWASTLSNLDLLSTGALIAIAIRKYDPIRIRNFLFVLSVVFLVAYTLFIRVFLHSNPVKTPFALTGAQGQAFFVLLLPVIAFTIVSLVSTRNLFIRVFFENKLIVYIGKISYGIYLFHLPCFAFIDAYFNHAVHPLIRLGGWGIFGLKIITAIFCAMISWHLFESKILKFKERFNYKFLGNENCVIGG